MEPGARPPLARLLPLPRPLRSLAPASDSSVPPAGQRAELEATWHGAADPAAPQWGPESKFLACTLKDEVRLPEGKWRRLVDTGMHSPYDVVPLAEAPAVRAVYEMDANSAIVLAPAKCAKRSFRKL
eukprot:tig00000955_g5783.t1